MAEEKIPQTIYDRPELKYLERHVRDNLCAACEDNPEAWKDLGMELLPVGDDTVTTLKTISVNSHGNIIKCCSSLFSLWLDRQPEATWRQLIQALTKIKLNNLAMKIEHNFMPSSAENTNIIVPHMQQGSSTLPNTSTSTSELFKEPMTISNAYTKLLKQLCNILENCDISALRMVLINQANTPDGIQFDKSLKDEIKSAKSSTDLLSTFGDFSCCNWLDIRLLEVLTNDLPSAVEIIEAYKQFLSTKQLTEVLPKKLDQLENRKAYVTAVSTKVNKDPEKITVGDFIKHCWNIEEVVFDLGKQILNIQHVEKGCLEINFTVPVQCSFGAYKMSLCNQHKFYTISLMHIEIGDNPLIYDPWLSNLGQVSTGQTMHDRYQVAERLCGILLDKVSIDNIVTLFHSHKFITDDDLEVISFIPSEYLKRQILLRGLRYYKLVLWLQICDIVDEHVGSQLREGLKHQFPNTEHEKLHVTLDNIRQVANSKVICTLHGARTIKLRFFDDSTLFNKPQVYHSRKLSLYICPFQNVKHIKPSDVEKEFHYISGHSIQLLSCCHPELLIKWCENLMASKKHDIKLLPPYSMYKLRKLRTSSSILKLMSIFWSWSNHSILTCLLEFSEIAAALLEEFDSRLYMNSSITKYPISSSLAPAMIPHNNKSFTVLTLKCDKKLQVTLQLVYDIQSMMIEKCEITEHALQLLAVQSSPLVLQWMISKYVVTVINVNVRRHQEYFATKGITEISIHPNIKHCIDVNLKLLPIREKGNELYYAAGTGNVAETKRLIQSGVYVDSTNELGETPLIQASLGGHEKVVEVLLTAGADVNFVDKDGWAPIFVASLCGYDKVVEVLLTAGADVNLATKDGRTPIFTASWRGYDKVVEVLLTAGADVNLPNKLGETPIYEASLHGYDKVVEVLLTAGADVNLPNELGETPIYVASLHGYDKVVEVLLTAGADVNLPNEEGETPVDVAIREGHHKVIDVLLKSAVNINIDSKVKLEEFSKSVLISSRSTHQYPSSYSSDSGYSGSSSMSIHSGSTWSSSGLKLGSVSVRMTGETLIMEEPHVDIEDPSLPGKELKSTVATSSDED